MVSSHSAHSDPWLQQGIFHHATAGTAHWVFSLFEAISYKPQRWLCQFENPSRSAVWKKPDQPVWHQQAGLIWIPSLPRSDARFELQHDISTKSTCLSCRRAIGRWAISVSRQMINLLNKVVGKWKHSYKHHCPCRLYQKLLLAGQRYQCPLSALHAVLWFAIMSHVCSTCCSLVSF